MGGFAPIFPAFDCKTVGGQRKTDETSDPDGPSCYVKPLPDGPFPTIDADDNSKRRNPNP